MSFMFKFVNSCVNPIVYAFMSRNFRNCFKNTLCVCAPRNDLHMRVGDRRQGSRRDSFQRTIQCDVRGSRGTSGRGVTREGISLVYTHSSGRSNTRGGLAGNEGQFRAVKNPGQFDAMTCNFD